MGDNRANILIALAVIILTLIHRTTGGSWKNLERKLMQDHHSSKYFEDKNRIHFPDEDNTKPSWHPDSIPQEEDALHICLSSCAVSKEYSPVCGTNGVTYQNIGQLQCAMVCGIEVRLHYRFPCMSKPPLTTTSAPITTSPRNFEQESCIRTCPSTPEYNPVCGTDYVTYNNIGKLECAKYCGVDVQFLRHSRCPIIISSSTTPPTTTSEILDIEIQNCISNCPATSQYDPVCGTDNVTYYNIGKLECAKACGVKGFKIPCTNTSEQCLKQAIQAVIPQFVRGIPSLGIITLDPFQVDKIELKMPGGLTIEFREGQSKGLRKCIVESASLIRDKYHVILLCNFNIKGKYNSHGNMFMFPIDGEGNATIICKDIRIECSLKLDTTSKNGKKYFKLKEYDIKHSYEGHVFYKITNLFKGNPEISDMVLEFMNRNWRIIAEEFGDPIVKYGIDSVLINVQKMIDIVPIDKFFRL